MTESHGMNECPFTLLGNASVLTAHVIMLKSILAWTIPRDPTLPAIIALLQPILSL